MRDCKKKKKGTVGEKIIDPDGLNQTYFFYWTSFWTI